MTTQEKILQDLLRIQQVYYTEGDIAYTIKEQSGRFYLHVDGDTQNTVEVQDYLGSRFGSYPVHIGTCFDDARSWILEEFARVS